MQDARFALGQGLGTDTDQSCVIEADGMVSGGYYETDGIMGLYSRQTQLARG